jgi:Na+/phosphate symporter
VRAGLAGLRERSVNRMAEQTIKDLKKDMYLVLHKSLEMLELAEEGFIKNKTASLDNADAMAVEIHAKEDILTERLAKMAATDNEARQYLSVPAHIEKIAINIKRISENSRNRIKEGLLFSDKAIAETEKLFAAGKSVLKKASDTAVTGSSAAMNAIAADCENLEHMANGFATAHEERLVTGECAPKSSSTYLCILYAFEDMGAHIKNMVKKFSSR